jgi:hypothetical protein
LQNKILRYSRLKICATIVLLRSAAHPTMQVTGDR